MFTFATYFFQRGFKGTSFLQQPALLGTLGNIEAARPGRATPKPRPQTSLLLGNKGVFKGVGVPQVSKGKIGARGGRGSLMLCTNGSSLTATSVETLQLR